MMYPKAADMSMGSKPSALMASFHDDISSPGYLSLVKDPIDFPFLELLMLSINFEMFFLSLSSLSLTRSLTSGTVLLLSRLDSSGRKNSIFFMLARKKMFASVMTRIVSGNSYPSSQDWSVFDLE